MGCDGLDIGLLEDTLIRYAHGGFGDPVRGDCIFNSVMLELQQLGHLPEAQGLIHLFSLGSEAFAVTAPCRYDYIQLSANENPAQEVNGRILTVKKRRTTATYTHEDRDGRCLATEAAPRGVEGWFVI